MIVGVTASRRTPTAAQVVAVEGLLRWAGAHTLRHGDCVGGDELAHNVALGLGLKVVIHPPTDDKLRAFCWQPEDANRVMVVAPEPYLTRNKQIVKGSGALVALPKEDFTVGEPAPARGQGTWSTVRYARSVGKPVLIIWPSGMVTGG